MKKALTNEVKKAKWSSEWMRLERKDTCGSHVESCVMEGLMHSEYYFNTLDCEEFQRILNSTARRPDWRVYRVGTTKIVVERLDWLHRKPMYRTWVAWHNHKSHKVYTSENLCSYQKPW